MRLLLNIKIKVDINEVFVEVVIEIVVQVIIIFDKLYEFLILKLFVLKRVVLYVVGRDFKMIGCNIGLVIILIGLQVYLNVEVYVVLIKDDMFLGLDFLY